MINLKFSFLLSLVLLAGCGVKGRPLPPETPRDIGIGRPSYPGVDQEVNRTSPSSSKKKKGSSQQ